MTDLRAPGLEPILPPARSGAALIRVTRAIGIGTVHAEALPKDKAEVGRRLQAEGGYVVMAGGG
ncbi:hypothetical protein [Streptomyces sp. NPDC056796]|uniref:hypothetical protein n=1 Tax=Streptomyces sp. NPDC056796 TaxID=3345947 RepID=UPI0036BDF7AF